MVLYIYKNNEYICCYHKVARYELRKNVKMLRIYDRNNKIIGCVANVDMIKKDGNDYNIYTDHNFFNKEPNGLAI